MDLCETVQNTKLFLFDMDGTLYLGDRLFDFSRELLQAIRAAGGKLLERVTLFDVYQGAQIAAGPGRRPRSHAAFA